MAQTTGLPNSGRPAMFRQRPLLLAGILVAGIVVAGVQYKRMAIARNERAQRDGQGANFYVSVDRSGGGI
ncbi:hypothetical protein ANO14919_037330 [Xylariales sp. No.14919]|nr:hypothetical protein ANO14919_037330 [Xylariales sp. No.14919]